MAFSLGGGKMLISNYPDREGISVSAVCTFDIQRMVRLSIEKNIPLHRNNVASQIALHPEQANHIKIEGLSFNIHTVGDINRLEWLRHQLPTRTTKAGTQALVKKRNENPKIQKKSTKPILGFKCRLGNILGQVSLQAHWSMRKIKKRNTTF